MKQHPAKAFFVLLTTLLVALATHCPAQTPYQHRYTTANGLLHPEAFVNFTQNGEAWIAYSNGEYLTQFDGVNWTHYHLPSLKIPSALVFVSDDKNGVWFYRGSEIDALIVRRGPAGDWHQYNLGEGKLMAYNHFLGSPILYDQSLYPYQYKAKLDSFVRDAAPLFRLPDDEVVGGVGKISDGSVYFTTRRKGSATGNYYFKTKDQWLKEEGNTTDWIHPFFLRNMNLTGATRIQGRPYWYANGKILPVTPVLPDGRPGHVADYLEIRNHTLHSGVYFPGIIVEDLAQNQWYLYEMDSLGQAQFRLGPFGGEYSKSATTRDKNGDWWYSTSSSLVRVSEALLTFDESNPEMVSGLHTIAEDEQGHIWFGGYGGTGGFSVFDGKTLQKKYFTDGAMRIMPGAMRSKSGTLYFLSEYEGGLLSIRNGQLKTARQLKLGNLIGYYAIQISDGRIALGLGSKGLGLATETNGLPTSVRIIGKEKGLRLDNVLTITEDRAGRLWMGRISQGIALYDPVRDTAVTWLRSPEMPQSVGTISSCLDDDGSVWFGGHNGLYRLPKAQDFDYLHRNVFDFLEKIHLPGNDTTIVYFLQNTPDFVVAGTQQAVYFFEKKYRGKRPRIFTLQYGKDLPDGGSEQNAVLLDSKGFLWVGAQEGATRINLSLLQFDTTATTLRLSRFTAGGDTIGVADDQIGRLPLKKRNIVFSFFPSGNALLKDDLFFDIAVVNGQGDTLFWLSQTRQRGGEMPYLPKGEYMLHVTAYKHNVVSGQVAWAFNVPRLPSENPWVWAGMALVVMGIPFTYFYLKKRHQAELERSRRERDALQIRALSNFFNPHFINNALHWVQSRYRKDADTATIVGRLSENVDHLFENTQSGKAYHSLKKELEIVQNYLKIQQVRFGEGLRVSLDLPQGEEEISGVAVPSMLLQIHAENAVEKGIRNRKGAGHFLLSVKMEADGCHLTIEDDGRGRPATTLGRKGSTAVMDDLIALFNRYNKQHLTVRYDDAIFEDENGERHGTRVHFFIPKNYNYEFS